VILGRHPRAQLRHLRNGLRVASQLQGLSREEVLALTQLARTVAKENIAPRTSARIDPTAWISPLASLRFTERVEIGAKASVGPYCCVWGGWSRTWARVGAQALLSPGVVLVAGNHGVHGHGPVREQPIEELDVTIGAGSWIGAHATVVGCRVGDGAVVGAGSVVLDDVPDHAIVVGIPARVVGHRSP
jgi:acetyltransferase-like isoleucine patch superfamily enzyme